MKNRISRSIQYSWYSDLYNIHDIAYCHLREVISSYRVLSSYVIEYFHVDDIAYCHLIVCFHLDDMAYCLRFAIQVTASPSYSTFASLTTESIALFECCSNGIEGDYTGLFCCWSLNPNIALLMLGARHARIRLPFTHTEFHTCTCACLCVGAPARLAEY